MKRTCRNCRWHNRKCVCTFYRNSNFGRVVYACDHCIDFKEKTTIIEKIGEPAVLEQLAEECSELAQAALTLKVNVKLNLEDAEEQIRIMKNEFDKLKRMASELQETLDKVSLTFDKLDDDDDDDGGDANAE